MTPARLLAVTLLLAFGALTACGDDNSRRFACANSLGCISVWRCVKTEDDGFILEAEGNLQLDSEIGTRNLEFPNHHPNGRDRSCGRRCRHFRRRSPLEDRKTQYFLSIRQVFLWIVSNLLWHF